jgi:hypothetical protein
MELLLQKSKMRSMTEHGQQSIGHNRMADVLTYFMAEFSGGVRSTGGGGVVDQRTGYDDIDDDGSQRI